ncbi:hypothetical protein VNO77_43317 [Canavalia gladiata]|uniref:Uncharacterized protein n=1 Tax=Canavalia gladiata TaxID=3824 RepID=A0AAN9JW20_CANGL
MALMRGISLISLLLISAVMSFAMSLPEDPPPYIQLPDPADPGYPNIPPYSPPPPIHQTHPRYGKMYTSEDDYEDPGANHKHDPHPPPP